MFKFFDMLKELENAGFEVRAFMDTDKTDCYLMEIDIKYGNTENAQAIIQKFLVNKELREIHTEMWQGMLIEEVYDYLDYRIAIEY